MAPNDAGPGNRASDADVFLNSLANNFDGIAEGTYHFSNGEFTGRGGAEQAAQAGVGMSLLQGSGGGRTPLKHSHLTMVAEKKGITMQQMGFVVESTYLEAAKSAGVVDGMGSKFPTPKTERRKHYEADGVGTVLHVKGYGNVRGTTVFGAIHEVKARKRISGSVDRNEILGAMEALANSTNPEYLTPPYPFIKQTTGRKFNAVDVGAALLVLVVPADATISADIYQAASGRGINVFVRRMFFNQNKEIIFGAAQQLFVTETAKKNWAVFSKFVSAQLGELQPIKMQYEKGLIRAKQFSDRYKKR